MALPGFTPEPLPPQYAWLSAIEQPPLMIANGLAELGLAEIKGVRNNPHLMQMARDLGLERQVPNDEQAWCGLWMAHIARISGKPVVAQPLWALNWRGFGMHVDDVDAALGDVLTFFRRNSAGAIVGGHVGLYVGDDPVAFHVLGGNQGDRVSIARVARETLAEVRRPPYRNAPASVRPHKLRPNGTATESRLT